MYYSAQTIKDYSIQATDGSLGSCLDLLMDEERCTIRYFVADTRKWLPGRKVLLSPASLDAVSREKRQLLMALSVELARNAPPLDSDAPVSRIYEQKWAHYFGLQRYWLGPELWGASLFPASPVGILSSVPPLPDAASEAEHSGIRSTGELCGYAIQTCNGQFGTVSDFLINSRTWAVELIVCKPEPGTREDKFVVPTTWLESIDCESKSVTVNAASEHLVVAPGFNPTRAASDDAPALRDYARQPAPERMGEAPKSKRRLDKVDEASRQSFPASDAPAF